MVLRFLGFQVSNYSECHVLRNVFFSCSFFAAVIYTHINIHITHFHLYHSVNIY